jgi:hypothetical protein
MSLYSEFQFGAANAVPTGGLANVANSTFSVRVEEDEMSVVLRFSGSLLNAGAATWTGRFAVDGTAQSTLPIAGGALLAGAALSVAFEQTVTLTKGEHKVSLQLNTSIAATTIDGAVVRSTFSANRLSSAATLAHGVDSKVQGIY